MLRGQAGRDATVTQRAAFAVRRVVSEDVAIGNSDFVTYFVFEEGTYLIVLARRFEIPMLQSAGLRPVAFETSHVWPHFTHSRATYNIISESVTLHLAARYLHEFQFCTWHELRDSRRLYLFQPHCYSEHWQSAISDAVMRGVLRTAKEMSDRLIAAECFMRVFLEHLKLKASDCKHWMCPQPKDLIAQYFV